MLLLCPSCQTGSPPKARFCPSCGTDLAPAAATTNTQTTAAVSAAAVLTSTESEPDAATAAFHGNAPSHSTISITPARPPVRTFATEPDAPSTGRRSAVPDSPAPTPTPPPSAPRPPAARMPSPPPVSPLRELADEEAVVTVAFNMHRIFVTGHPTTAEVSLENNCAQPVEALTLELHSSALGAPIAVQVRRIAPGQTIRRLLEISPARAGNMVLNCSLQLQAGGEVLNYRGERTLRVLQEPGQQGNINIVVQDLFNNSGTNAGLGADTGHVEIKDLIGKGVIKDLNSLLEHESEEHFVPLPLELDFSLSMKDVPVSGQGLRIPAALLTAVQPATCLKLTPQNGGTGVRALHLVSRDRFVLGRSRDDADFLTWFWPRSTANDEATRHLSKAHLIATTQHNQILLTDNNSANGAQLDRQSVPNDRGLPFTERGVLRIGADYEIDVWHDAGVTKGQPAVSNAVRWPGPTAITKPILGSVRFSPRTCEPALWDAVWLFTDAAFGRSKSNPIVLDVPGLAEIQGRFHHWRGCFWLERAHAEGTVMINDTSIQVGEFAPLITGQQVVLGERMFRVETVA